MTNSEQYVKWLEDKASSLEDELAFVEKAFEEVSAVVEAMCDVISSYDLSGDDLNIRQEGQLDVVLELKQAIHKVLEKPSSMFAELKESGALDV